MSNPESSCDIERFLDRLTYSCSEGEHVSFRQEALREWVAELAAQHTWAAVKAAALARLEDPDPRMIERAVSCLFAIGDPDTAPSIKGLLSHPDFAVQKAARTCLFELRQNRNR